jgi:hypothetical protein
MRQVESILGELSAVGAASFGLAYLLEKRKVSKTRMREPAIGQPVRLFVGSHVARCRYLGKTKSGWRLSSPVTRGEAAEMKLGQTLKGEVTEGNGVILFRSTLESREPDGDLILKEPDFSCFRDRRIDPRRTDAGTGKLENVPAKVSDLSSSGIRLQSSYKAHLGERVRIDLPNLSDPVFGWVLGQDGDEVRVRFEERLVL